jgi:hypothetical protein
MISCVALAQLLAFSKSSVFIYKMGRWRRGGEGRGVLLKEIVKGKSQDVWA